MKTVLQILRYPPGSGPKYRTAHHVWLAVCLTALGCCVGALALRIAANSYEALDGAELFRGYVENRTLLLLNLLPPVALIWLFYFLSRRAWAGFLGSWLPTVGVALVNYYKIRLRADPFLAADLRLAAEAGNIVGGYSLELSRVVWLALISLPAGLAFAVLLMPNGLRGWRARTAGALACLALIAAGMATVYADDALYQAETEKNSLINRWSDVEIFISKGCVYPFLHSVRDMFPRKPAGYDKKEAAALLEQYPDADIPEERKVSVLGIMLEAFCDLTDFPALADEPGVAGVYGPWHALEEASVSGDLLTNIFAGGTVDSEWGFLTGDTAHGDFRGETGSYVWYLKAQGYQTFGSHPGYGWFYNRQNVNRYLGFDEYWFSENHYAKLVDPIAAQFRSDGVLTGELLRQIKERTGDGPCFSFSVSYQNHGPYDAAASSANYLTAASGLSGETRNIFNNYLAGVSDTIGAVTGLASGLEELDAPVVLVLFGDHKPWAGNGNSAYTEIGADFDLAEEEGFYQYYSTPYVIWANSAAKEALGRGFTGDGGDFSPCFLMEELFEQCGWEGPSFMRLARELRELTPLVHERGLFWRDGGLTDTLPPEEASFYQEFLGAQYFRENELAPGR